MMMVHSVQTVMTDKPLLRLNNDYALPVEHIELIPLFELQCRNIPLKTNSTRRSRMNMANNCYFNVCFNDHHHHDPRRSFNVYNGNHSVSALNEG